MLKTLKTRGHWIPRYRPRRHSLVRRVRPVRLHLLHRLLGDAVVREHAVQQVLEVGAVRADAARDARYLVSEQKKGKQVVGFDEENNYAMAKHVSNKTQAG